MLPQLDRRRFLIAASASVFCGHAPIARSANDAHRWIVAIGGCGGNLLDACQHGMPMRQRIRTMRIDYATNEAAFRARPADSHIRLHDVYGGSGREPAQAAFDLATRFDLISRTLAEAADVFILAGIGGGTGYGATLALAGQLSQREVAIEVIAVTPFVFEQPVSNVGMRIDTLRHSARVKAMSPVVSSTDEAVDRALLRCQRLVSVACMNWIKR